MSINSISIIIPTYNRPNTLYKTLEALGKQNYDGAFEIVIVNDGGCEISYSLLPESLQYMKNKVIIQNLRCNKGVSHARNMGAKLSKYSILGFLDDDTIPAENWIDSTVKFFLQNKQIGACVGKIEVETPNCALEKLRHSVYEKRHKENIAQSKKKSILESFWGEDFVVENHLYITDYLSGGNCAIRKEVFTAIGGFDQIFKVGQDREIALRILQNKYYVVYNDNLIVKHKSDSSILQLIKGRFKSGLFNALMYDKYLSVYSKQEKNKRFSEYFSMTIYDYYKLYGLQTTFLGFISIWSYIMGQKVYYMRKFL